MVGRGKEIIKAYTGFEPDAKKLVVATVFAALGDAPVWFLLSLYLNHLGFSKVELGQVIFLMSICSVLPLLPAGHLSDRYGRRKMIFLGIFMMAIGLFFLWRANELNGFYLAVSFWGVGHAFYNPSFMGFLSEKVEERRRKFLFGFQMAASMFASACIILLVGFLPAWFSQTYGVTEQEGFRWVFLIGFVFVLLQLLPLALTKSGSEGGSKDELIEEPSEKNLPPLPKVTLFKLCLPMALLGLGAGLVIPFFQVYFQWRFDTSIEGIGILFAFTNFLWAGAYLLTPYAADKKGSVKLITMLHTIAIFALVAIPVSPNFEFVAIAYIIRMVIMNSTWPISQSYSLSQVPREHRSLTLSAINFSFNLTKAITPLAAGYLFQMSLELPFMITAVLYSIATVTFYLFFRKMDDKVKDKGSVPVLDHME